MFVIPCPLYDDVLFENFDEIKNISIQQIEVVKDMFNLTTTAGNLYMVKEAHELYETYGSQQCAANFVALGSKVSECVCYIFIW